MSEVSISICIPAYQKAAQLTKLLRSLEMQTFRNFEVIISDDSPDNTVRLAMEPFRDKFKLHYRHNHPALGTPENWNAAMRMAGGEWIKMMHDDDWFDSPSSLQELFDCTAGGAGFVFCGYHIVEGKRIRSTNHLPQQWVKILQEDPRLLMRKNVIGHPSVTLHRNFGDRWYDNRMKWMVDIDFYIRCLQGGAQFAYTSKPLVNIGYHPEQVTKSVFTNKKVVIGENMLLLDKLGADILNNMQVYDYFWRLMRNYEVRDAEELRSLTAVEIPSPLIRMLAFRKKIPQVLLKAGPFSKAWMLLAFLTK